MTQSPPLDEQHLQQYLLRRRFARECALQFLYQVDRTGAKDWEAEDLELFWQQVSELEDGPPQKVITEARAFAERLIRGVFEHRDVLDETIAAQAKNWTLERMDVVDRNILRLGAFELLFCDDVPDLASINEAVELAKEFGHADSGSFVNGILDQLRKEHAAGLDKQAGPGSGVC